MTAVLRPARVPGPAAARAWDGLLLVDIEAGPVVHLGRPAPLCGDRRLSRWSRAPSGDELAAVWLCATCEAAAGIDPATVDTTAVELATVHAHDVRRAEERWTPEARHRVRVDARSAAIADGSLIAHLSAVAERRPLVWPVDVAPIPTAAEAYGDPVRPPWATGPRTPRWGYRWWAR